MSSLTSEQLLILDTLAYYGALSNNYLPYVDSSTGETTYYKLEDFLNDVRNNGYHTCMNGLLGQSDEALGMLDFVDQALSDETLKNLIIVYPAEDCVLETTSSVCLIDRNTNEVYVIYGGNYGQGDFYPDYDYTDPNNPVGIGESMNTWVSNALAGVQTETDEQRLALDFYNKSIEKARECLGSDIDLDITVSGHSNAGNLAEYVTIAYNGDDNNKVDNCVAFDAPGFSTWFLDYYSAEIAERAEIIHCINPTISIVGSLLHSIPGVDYTYIQTGFPSIPIIGYHLPAELLDDSWNLKNESLNSYISIMINCLTTTSVDLADFLWFIDAEKALKNVGHILDEIANADGILNTAENILPYLCDPDTLGLFGCLITTWTVFKEACPGIILILAADDLGGGISRLFMELRRIIR